MNEDVALLRRYAKTRDEPAFAELVRRHVGLVYGAALRQVGGDTHRAEEITQTVFTDLARKAHALAGREIIASWLYTSTRYAAANARRAERRRQKYEQEAFMHELTGAPPRATDWDRLRPMIDELMHELNERDRAAVVLRHFENRAFVEIGATLGVTEDAARMRVERALEKLHLLLARRGVTSSSAAVAAALGNQAIAVAPAGLAASIAGSALSEVADVGASAGVLAFMTATKTTIVLGIAATLATATALHQMQRSRAAATTFAGDRNDLAALRTQWVVLAARAQAEENELADVKAAAARNAAAKAVVQAAALERQNAARALQQFLDADPQLQQLRRERDLQTAIIQHLPLGLGLELTADELAQVAKEFNRRLEAKIPIDDSNREGLPAKLANDPRFIEAWKLWDTRQVVESFNARLWDPLNATQAAQLIHSIQSARPNPVPPDRGYETIQKTVEWERVLADAGGYLSPSQLAALRGYAAQSRTKLLLALAAKQANR